MKAVARGHYYFFELLLQVFFPDHWGLVFAIYFNRLSNLRHTVGRGSRIQSLVVNQFKAHIARLFFPFDLEVFINFEFLTGSTHRSLSFLLGQTSNLWNLKWRFSNICQNVLILFWNRILKSTAIWVFSCKSNYDFSFILIINLILKSVFLVRCQMKIML